MTARYEGYVEAVVDGRVRGWVWSPMHPERRVSVSVLLDGHEVSSGRADHPRAALADVGVGDGHHVFDVALPPASACAPGHRLEVRVGPERIPLPPSAAFTGRSASGRFANTEFVPVVSGRGARWWRFPLPPAWVLLCAAAALFGLLLMVLTRRHTFLGDDWGVVTGTLQWNLATLFRPVDNELAAVPVLVYKTFLSLFGLDATWAWRLLVCVLHAACAVLVWLVARRRFGDWWALLPAGLLLLLGAGWPVLLGWRGIGVLAAVAAGLGALLQLDRGERRNDVLACGLLVLACASSVAGIVFAVVAAAELTGARKRRAWVAAVPLVAYLVWWLGDGADGLSARGALDFPRDFVRGLSETLGGLVGAGAVVGSVMLVGGVLLLARTASRGCLTPRSAAAVLGLVVLWFGVAVTGGDTGATHLYVSAVLVLLLVCGTLRAPACVPARTAEIVGAALLFVALAGCAELIRQADDRNAQSRDVRAALGAADIAAASADRQLVPAPQTAPGVTVQSYARAAGRYGSRLAVPRGRDLPALDRRLAHIERIAITARPRTATAGATPPTVAEAVRGRLSDGRRCPHFAPFAGASGALAVPVRPGRTLLVATTPTGDVRVSTRRFASTGAVPLGRVTGSDDRVAAIRFPADGSARAWTVLLASRDRVQLCVTGG